MFTYKDSRSSVESSGLGLKAMSLLMYKHTPPPFRCCLMLVNFNQSGTLHMHLLIVISITKTMKIIQLLGLIMLKTLLLLFKSLALSLVDNGSQLLSPHHKQHICLIEKIQRSFTKHIDGMKDLQVISREIVCFEV